MPERARPKRTTRRDDRRGSANQRGYTYRWQQASRAFLDLHPLCVVCRENNQVTAATVVDHKTPHRGDRRLFWDQTNWQPLCERCHNVKTAKGQ